MSKDDTIRWAPGAMPDGREFTAREVLAKDVIALGTLEDLGRHEDSGLAGALIRIGGVCGVKLEDNTALVIVRDPSDWDVIQPTVITVIGEHLRKVPADEKSEAATPEHLDDKIAALGLDGFGSYERAWIVSEDQAVRSRRCVNLPGKPVVFANFSPNLSWVWLADPIREERYLRGSKFVDRTKGELCEILKQMLRDESAAGASAGLPEPRLTGPWPAASLARKLEIPPLEKERPGSRALCVGKSEIMF